MINMKKLLLVLVIVFAVQLCFASDAYKPYLHQPVVAEHPEIRLYGQYNTNLFPGSGTYSFPITVPEGTNGLKPEIILSYNSQNMNGIPTVVGAGWQIHQDSIIRDVNGTPDDVSDDEFVMVVDNVPYQLVYLNHEKRWHTEVEYHFKIENLSSAGNEHGMYWMVTKKDGTKYRYGNQTNSEMGSNAGKIYAVQWHIDQIEDTHGNRIFFSYVENPYVEDNGASYITKIEYNSGKERRIEFSYEGVARPDKRERYEQGNNQIISRRLSDIFVYTDDYLVRRYSFTYSLLADSTSTLADIAYFGSDNNSILFDLEFSYYEPGTNYTKITPLWVPPVLFSSSATDNGVRFVDFNNDGYSDIVTNSNVYINNKTSGWDLDSSITIPEAIISSNIDQGVRFADVNNDGFTDLIKSYYGTRMIYIHNSSAWVLDYNWTFPIDIVTSGGVDNGVRLADANGDGRVDILRSISGSESVYIHNGQGWDDKSYSWNIPVDFITTTDIGVRLADINGDGYIDILQGGQSTKKAWLGNGLGWNNYDDTWRPPVAFIDAINNDSGVRLVDVNGDGLIDILEQSDHAYINNGSGWVQNDTWKSPVDFIGTYNIGRRLADVNGDGFLDIVISEDNPANQYTWVRDDIIPYFLKGIINEYGGNTTIYYTKSTQFDNTVNNISGIGFNIFVVSGVRKDNSLSGSFNAVSSTSYNYSYAKYNYDNNEFRGFGLSVEINSDSVVKHYFHQDDPRRAKEYMTEVYDSDEVLFYRNEKDYNFTFVDGVYNVSLLYSDDYVFDGNDEPMIRKSKYDYGLFDNLYRATEYGDLSVDGDERVTEYKYAFDAGPWIVDRISKKNIYDLNGDKISEIKYYYDNLGLGGIGSHGDLTKAEKWLDGGNNSFMYYEYDSFGNLIAQTDSLGNKVKYSYDATNTYQDSFIDALGHVSYTSYNLGTGNLLWSENNNIRTSYEYDVFGRLVKEIKPYDSASLPTKSYSYDIDGIAPEKVEVKLKSTSNKTLGMEYYYDGFGNIVQLKSEAEGQDIVKNLFYDSSFRIYSEQNPYFDNFSDEMSEISPASNYTYYSYDCMDRVISILNPDGLSRNITFNQTNITEWDPNSNKHKYTIDGFDRIVNVFEYNTNDVGGYEEYVTSYSYDANDNLVRITDSVGNEFLFEFDSLGRKVSMEDPDLGTWLYSYDSNGNLVSQIDSRGEEIRMSYDAHGRVLRKASNNFSIEFNYDRDYYGTLTNISMGEIIYNFEYDDRLRIIKEIQDIADYTLDRSFLYDSQDRLVSEGYPSIDIDYVYNSQGQVKSIPGYISGSDYNAFGSILDRTYQNGLASTYYYYHDNNRLSRINVPTLMDLSYGYDAVGNIVSLNDSVLSKNSVMTYDNLDRLRSATIGQNSYEYSYSRIGNILKITDNNISRKFIYDGDQAHAPSRIINETAGVDVYNLLELDTGSLNRTVEFFLINDGHGDHNRNLTVIFGDGSSLVNDNITISDNLMVFVQHAYVHGGDYSVNVISGNDLENLAVKFGLIADNLANLFSNATKQVFEFVLENNIEETIEDASWNCSDSVGSSSSFELNGKMFDYITHNISVPGNYVFACSGISSDGNDSRETTFTVPGLEISDYDVLSIDVSKRVVYYSLANNFEELDVNVSMAAEDDEFSELVSIPTGQNVMVFAETNYSSDGVKEFFVNATSGDYTVLYTEVFKTEGAVVENYHRELVNYTNNVVMFNVRNNWHEGDVNWSFNELSNSSYLGNNESVLVVIEDSGQDERAEVTAKTCVFEDTLKNAYYVHPLEISSLEALNEGMVSVSEIVVRNNLNSTQQMDWSFDSGESVYSNDDPVEITDYVFVFVESNHSTQGVYSTQAFVNSTEYNHSRKGVVVI